MATTYCSVLPGEVEKFVATLTLPLEVRVIDSKRGRIVGYYDDADALARDVADLSSRPDVGAVYVTANPVRRDLLARSYNRLTEYARVSTQDAEIERRTKVFVDVDPARPNGTMATEEERQKAADVAYAIRDDLEDLVGLPMLVDSGSGIHLYYDVDLPNDQAANALVTSFLKALSKKYTVPGAVTIDTSVSNAARIAKVPGTWVRKGDHVPDLGRTHRLSRLIDVPADRRTLTAEDLRSVVEHLGGAVTETQARSATAYNPGDADAVRDWVDGLFDGSDVRLVRSTEYQGGHRWVVDCPLCGNNDASGVLILNQDGWLNYVCQHASSCKYNKETEPRDRLRAILEALGGVEAVGAWERLRPSAKPTGPDYDTLLNDMFGGGHGAEADQGAPPAPQAVEAEERSRDGRPVIRKNGVELHDKVDQAVASIEAVSGGRYYRGPEGISEIVDGQIRPLDVPQICELMSRAARWVTISVVEKRRIVSVTDPPKNVAEVIKKKTDLALPRLDRVITTPVFDSKGRLIDRPGYHETAGLYLLPSGLEVRVPEKPTPGQVWAAKSWLVDQLLVDFPFASAADRANCVALLLLPFVREMITSPTPFHLIEAPQASTGKGLIADVFAIVSTGTTAQTQVLGENDAEVRKQVTTALASGAPYLDYDNVTSLRSVVLEQALTSNWWRDRMLGTNREGLYPIRLTWLATGNNVAVGRRDMARRILRIRLDAKCEDPHLRPVEEFKHSNLRGWAMENRGALVSACLTLCRAWIEAGKPGAEAGTPQRGSYEAWRDVMGGILSVAGIPGFLASDADSLADLDEDKFEWGTFCDAWANSPGGPTFKRTAAQLLDLANQRTLLESIRYSKSPNQVMGHALRRRRDQVFGGWAIRSDRSATLNSTVYFLERLGPPVATTQGAPPVAAVEVADPLIDTAGFPAEIAKVVRNGDYDLRDGRYELKVPVRLRPMKEGGR